MNPTVDTNDNDWAITHYNNIPVEEIPVNQKDHDSNNSLNTKPLNNEPPLDGNLDAVEKTEMTEEKSM